ncbi:hypothetical protein [Flavobacterium aquiphilum]|uniref:hypothetical protein n=1 Tax=Flavobacterium aquiphilum TaxID=3003261 RepID=UPI002480BFFE|nr:hypothetical protein [Flavobacterium aquiphilum]
MAKSNSTQKINKKELSVLLGVSYKTARKDYQTILDSLDLKRNYLTVKDLEVYGIMS